MSTGGTANGRSDAGANGTPVRVVVVGRTAAHGVDRALRLDRSIELVRARTAVAAIGELSDPIDESSPEDVTVIVSPEAIAADRSAAFAGAVRRVSDRARILCLSEDVPEGFDGRLRMDDPASPATQQVRAMGRAPSVLPVPIPEPVESGSSSVEAHDSAAAQQMRAADPPSAEDDPPMTPEAAMATGNDAVAAALAWIARRLGAAEARFLAGATDGVGGAVEAPVSFGGRVLGRLVVRPETARAGRLPEAGSLEREAAGLGAWIALSTQQEQLRRAAFTDELTGAWNRRYFNRFLSAAINAAVSARHTVTLLVFDVDNFKVYNDRFGHTAGDEILVEVVRLLNACIRSTDRVCRVGGDEFAVIFHDPEGPRGPAGAPTSPRSIGDIVRRFQKQVCEHRFPKLGEMARGTLTLSGGMATFPWDGRTVQQLLDRADDLARQSKQQGKNAIMLGPGAEKACGME